MKTRDFVLKECDFPIMICLIAIRSSKITWNSHVLFFLYPFSFLDLWRLYCHGPVTHLYKSSRKRDASLSWFLKLENLFTFFIWKCDISIWFMWFIWFIWFLKLNDLLTIFYLSISFTIALIKFNFKIWHFNMIYVIQISYI